MEKKSSLREDVIFKSVVAANYGILFKIFVTASSSTHPLAAAPGVLFPHDARLTGLRQRADMGENTNTVLTHTK